MTKTLACILLLTSLPQLLFSQSRKTTCIIGYVNDSAVVIASNAKNIIPGLEETTNGSSMSTPGLNIHQAGNNYYLIMGTSTPAIEGFIAGNYNLAITSIETLSRKLALVINNEFDSIRLNNKDYFLQTINNKASITVLYFGVAGHSPFLSVVQYSNKNYAQSKVDMYTDIVYFTKDNPVVALGTFYSVDYKDFLKKLKPGNLNESLYHFFAASAQRYKGIGDDLEIVTINKNNKITRN